MTLQDLNKEQLDRLMSSKPLTDLITSRLEDIKEDDFKRRVFDVEGMLKREYNRGMASAYESLLNLPEAVKEELDLRDKEKLAREKKK